MLTEEKIVFLQNRKYLIREFVFFGPNREIKLSRKILCYTVCACDNI